MDDGGDHGLRRQLLVDLPRLVQGVAAEHAEAGGGPEDAGQLHDRFIIEADAAAVDDVRDVVAAEELLRLRRHGARRHQARMRGVVLRDALGERLRGILGLVAATRSRLAARASSPAPSGSAALPSALR